MTRLDWAILLVFLLALPTWWWLVYALGREWRDRR